MVPLLLILVLFQELAVGQGLSHAREDDEVAVSTCDSGREVVVGVGSGDLGSVTVYVAVSPGMTVSETVIGSKVAVVRVVIQLQPSE